MGRSVHSMRKKIFDRAKSLGINDPLTGCFASSERALSGFLCLYAQQRRVRWSDVPLYQVHRSLPQIGHADIVVEPSGTFVAEYLLLHGNKSEESVWGWMPADLLHASSDLTSVVIFENKIGGLLQYGQTPESKQLDRQLDYLIGLKHRGMRNVSLVLISGKDFFQTGWYCDALAGTMKYKDRSRTVPGYLLTWEDLLDAMAPGANRRASCLNRSEPVECLQKDSGR
jgi:hypothetical protein